MILEVTRSHIKVRIDDRTITIPGEMFFPPNDKMGFAFAMADMLSWDAPNELHALTDLDRQTIVNDIQSEFDQGGHTLEVT